MLKPKTDVYTFGDCLIGIVLSNISTKKLLSKYIRFVGSANVQNNINFQKLLLSNCTYRSLTCNYLIYKISWPCNFLHKVHYLEAGLKAVKQKYFICLNTFLNFRYMSQIIDGQVLTGPPGKFSIIFLIKSRKYPKIGHFTLYFKTAWTFP